MAWALHDNSAANSMQAFCFPFEIFTVVLPAFKLLITDVVIVWNLSRVLLV